MTRYLENLLETKTKETNGILYLQWKHDKMQVSKTINAISSFFPHFSLHDVSHSDEILNNIVRMLSIKTIANLSAIDIWLLLEAAYLHDIGMVLTGQDIEKCLKSKDFAEYVQNITTDSSHSLFEYASLFSINKDIITIKDNILSNELYEGIKFLLANYFRPKHAERSGQGILELFGNAPDEAPTGGIPKRIIQILADICSKHTCDFEQIMKMAYKENGLGNDVAHPRYIACLLRLGDLLDLDNNRFSHVFLSTINKLPRDSYLHLQKHLSISHFRLDSELIEVEAKCKDYNIATLIQQWLNCLNDEYIQQVKHWHQIIPNKSYGFLPTIADLKVIVEGYEYIDSKNKPVFKVDTAKALEMLQGAGLYNEAFQCIREIIQNSVDATLIRLWLDRGDSENLWEDPIQFAKDQDLKNYAINVTINKNDDKLNSDQITWKVKVNDHGIGISLNDVKYLETAGSSYKNIQKNKIINNMPEWMKPTGTFGIGFQSIFAITKEVLLSSKSYFDEQAIILELTDPRSDRKGEILIKKLKTTHKQKPGVEISFQLEVEKHPKNWVVSLDDSNASRIVRDFDPIEDESMDYEIGKIVDEIIMFNSYTYLPIILSINNQVLNLANEMSNSEVQKYVKETGCVISIGRGPTRAFYRNQEAETNIRYDFLSFNVNIFEGSSSDILTYNRNKIKSTFNRTLWTKTLVSAYFLIYDKFDLIFSSDNEKITGSMFIDYYWDSVPNNNFEKGKFSQLWRDYQLTLTDGKTISLSKILEKDEIIVRYSARPGLASEEYSIEGKKFIIEIKSTADIEDVTRFLLFIAKDIFLSIREIKPDDKQALSYEIKISKKIQPDPIDHKALVLKLQESKNHFLSGARDIIPCRKMYEKLRISSASDIRYMHDNRISPYVNIDYPRMLSPFVRKVRGGHLISNFETKLSDKLYELVYQNRYNINTTLDEIKKSYTKFVNDLKQIIK